MKTLLSILVLSCVCVARSAAATANDPVAGLPIAPGFEKTGDPIQSYKFCGKSARSVTYMGNGSEDSDHENTWYAHAMPNARVFTAVGGVKTFITPDGTAAVETAGVVISFLRFSPGLSLTQMKILGAAPASKSCTAE